METSARKNGYNIFIDWFLPVRGDDYVTLSTGRGSYRPYHEASRKVNGNLLSLGLLRYVISNINWQGIYWKLRNRHRVKRLWRFPCRGRGAILFVGAIAPYLPGAPKAGPMK
jgi:hypothetical protein